jgi:RimJ/RimL family protein N-acetyltransferase/catechol 2,3-dioxygenase-like lactoylglutathione lyase family enzyme
MPGQPATPLRTSRLDLVGMDLDRDLDALHAVFGDPRIDPFGTDDVSPDRAATRARLAREFGPHPQWVWVLRVRPDVLAAGVVGVFADQGSDVRGVSWYLSPALWGRGLMGEAARAVVDHLVTQPGVAAVEAWIDTRNVRSLGVARRVRLDERARLPRVYRDHVAQQVVMGRREPARDDDVLAVRANLPVRDVGRTVEVLSRVLGLHVAFVDGDPATFARLTVTPFAGSAGIDVVRAPGEVMATAVTVDVGVPADEVHRRAVDAGLAVPRPPQDTPWTRRVLTFLLPDGHAVTVHGPMRPTGRPA